MSVLEAIYQRRSIREFTDEPATREELLEIVRAGIWAPSGLNNQPWRFVLVRDAEIKERLAEQTHYGYIIRQAASLIVVFLDKDTMYDAVKDYQSTGACIQNMLLAVEAIGLGAVWLGQILKNKDKVREILSISEGLELMAVLAVGHPRHRDQKSTRNELANFIVKEF